MAKVPTIKTGQVKAQIAPNVSFERQVSLDTFVSEDTILKKAVSSALLRVGDAATRAALRNNKIIKDRSERATATEAFSGFNDELRKYHYGELSKKRGDTKGAYDNSIGQIEEFRKIHSKGLNENERRYFDAAVNNAGERTKDSLMGHETRETLAWSREMRDAYSHDLTEDAILYPDRVEEFEGLILVNTKANLKGADPKTLKQASETATDGLYSAVLKSKMQDPKDAQVFLDANWKKFEPSTRVEKKAEIKEMARQQEVSEFVLGAQPLPLDEQYALAEKEFAKDAESLKEANAEIKAKFSRKESLKILAEDEKVESEADKIAKDPLAYPGVPHGEFSFKRQKELERYAKTEKDAKAGIDARTDWVLYSDLKDKLARGDKVNPREFRDKLASTEYKEIDKLARGKVKPDFRIVTPYQQAKTAVKDAKRFKGEEGGQRLNRLLGGLNERIKDIPPNEVTTEVINDILYKDLLAPVDYGFWGTDIHRFEIPFIEDENLRTKTALDKDNIPEPLKDAIEGQNKTLDDVQYDLASGDYYTDSLGKREVYDQFGNFRFEVQLNDFQFGKR